MKALSGELVHLWSFAEQKNAAHCPHHGLCWLMMCLNERSCFIYLLFLVLPLSQVPGQMRIMVLLENLNVCSGVCACTCQFPECVWYLISHRQAVKLC